MPRYDFLKIGGYGYSSKFWTPVKPKIWVWEKKKSGFLNIFRRGTITPNLIKIGDIVVESYLRLSWIAPHSKFASYTQRRLPNPEHPAYGAALLKVTKEINVLHSRWDWKDWLNQMQKWFLHCSLKNLKIKKTKGYGKKRIQYSQLMFVAKCIWVFVYVHVC